MLATCPQQVVRVGLVEFVERHDTRTNGQHYTAADRRPTSQVSAWQAERENRPTRATSSSHLRKFKSRKDVARAGRVGEDVARMLRGNCSRGNMAYPVVRASALHVLCVYYTAHITSMTEWTHVDSALVNRRGGGATSVN